MSSHRIILPFIVRASGRPVPVQWLRSQRRSGAPDVVVEEGEEEEDTQVDPSYTS